MIRINNMFFIALQIFFAFPCQAKSSFQGLTIRFTSDNFSSAVNELEKQLSFNIIHDCNISMTNRFYDEKGVINVQCYNETNPYKSHSLQFDMIITIENKQFSYLSRAHHVCLLNSLCNGTFIDDWIQWQRIVINKIIQTKDALKKGSIKFQIWGLLDHNEPNLCFNISVNQNQNRHLDSNDTASNGLKTIDDATMITEINNTDKCIRYNDDYTSIIRNISTLIIELIDLIKPQRSFNDTKLITEPTLATVFDISSIERSTSSLMNTNQSNDEQTTPMMNRNKSNKKKLVKLLIFVTSIIFAFVLLTVLIICYVYCHNYRQGYRPAATS
jgi:hypothetical protein